MKLAPPGGGSVQVTLKLTRLVLENNPELDATWYALGGHDYIGPGDCGDGDLKRDEVAIGTFTTTASSAKIQDEMTYSFEVQHADADPVGLQWIGPCGNIGSEGSRLTVSPLTGASLGPQPIAITLNHVVGHLSSAQAVVLVFSAGRTADHRSDAVLTSTSPHLLVADHYFASLLLTTIK